MAGSGLDKKQMEQLFTAQQTRRQEQLGPTGVKDPTKLVMLALAIPLVLVVGVVLVTLHAMPVPLRAFVACIILLKGGVEISRFAEARYRK